MLTGLCEGEYGLQMEEIVLKPDTNGFVSLFVTNIYFWGKVCLVRRLVT